MLEAVLEVLFDLVILWRTGDGGGGIDIESWDKLFAWLTDLVILCRSGTPGGSGCITRG